MTDDPIDYDSILPGGEDPDKRFQKKAERLVDEQLKRLEKGGKFPFEQAAKCALCETCSERLADVRGILALAACLVLDPQTFTPEFRQRVRHAIGSHALREVQRNEAKEKEAGN